MKYENIGNKQTGTETGTIQRRFGANQQEQHHLVAGWGNWVRTQLLIKQHVHSLINPIHPFSYQGDGILGKIHH